MENLIVELQALVVRSLRLPGDPSCLDPDTNLFGGALGLDSVDAVQVLLSVERHFGVPISDAELAAHGMDTLRSLAALLFEKGVRVDRTVWTVA